MMVLLSFLTILQPYIVAQYNENDKTVEGQTSCYLRDGKKRETKLG